VEFRILGPLQVITDDGQRQPLGPRQTKVLAALLLAANRVLTIQQLIDTVWDDDPPTTARKQIQNCIWMLRKNMAVLADGPGYRIKVDAGQLDVQAFQDLVAEAQVCAANDEPARAVDHLQAALRLWRGPALAGIPGRTIEAGATRLEELRLAAVEQRLDLELQLGRHHGLVSELTELVAAHPLRERLAGQLMLALHRCGRQADALSVFQGVRTRLAEQLGLDPGTDLQDLHTRILRHDAGPVPARAAPPAATEIVPRQLPAGTRHFVGRAAELKDLTRLLDEADTAGTVVISAIDGTAGIGKTATAVQWAHRVASRFPGGQLYVNLRGFDPTGSPVTPAEAIRGFLDAFQVPADRIPASLDAQAALYRSLLAGRRVLVVLDNARDVDQVRPLLPGSGTCLVLVTSRSPLSGLVAREGAHLITLDLLTSDEAHDLLARHLGPDRLVGQSDAVDDLAKLCAHLPLALAIVAARAAAHPTFPLATLVAELADTRRRLDALDTADQATQVRAAFSWSYQQLGPPAARLFRLLGLHPGPDVSTPAAASLAGTSVIDARGLLTELTRAHLLTEHTPGRYTFHDLLRTYAIDMTNAHDAEHDRHAALLRVFDHYLHTAHAAALILHPPRKPVLTKAPQPGVTTEELQTYQAALAWYDAERQVMVATVEGAARAGFDAHVWQLAWTLTNFLSRRGHWTSWVTTQRLALAGARRLGNEAYQAYAHRGIGRACTMLGQDREALTHLQHALGLYRKHGAHIDEAHTHLTLGVLFEGRDRLDVALDHARQALHIFRTVNDQAGQADALNAVGWYCALLGNFSEAVTTCQEGLALQQRLGNREGESATWDSLGYAYHGVGHHDRAIHCYQQAVALRRTLGDRHGLAETLSHLGDVHHTAGQLDAAHNAWREALTVLDQLGHPNAERVRTKLHHLHSAATPTSDETGP
jgi:DNA-binding SARP family transcriptional activator/tetratricopeptide (TPR) repeat protein